MVVVEEEEEEGGGGGGAVDERNATSWKAAADSWNTSL